MIKVINANKISKCGDFIEIKFDFELDNSSVLPVKTYILGNTTYLIANNSTALNTTTNTNYIYNKGVWTKLLTKSTEPPTKSSNIYTENGDYNVINNELTGINNVKVMVDSPSIVLIDKTITANNTYNAIDDDADGYSSVIVDVANTYTNEDEGKVVDNGELVAQTAMAEEITENGTINTTLYNSVTVNVSSSGGSSGNDVVFYDYDGSVVISYSAADFANLTAMPTNPTHEGLTGQGWNWSLTDAKAYVATYGKLNIGQMYITSDGKTRVYFIVTKNGLSVDLYLALESDTELDVDWGDGSEHTTWTSADGDSSKWHEYASASRYVTAITVVTGEFYFSQTTYNMYNVEIGNSVTSIGDDAFNGCATLSSITIPNGVTSIGKSAFYECFGLSSITIPNGVTSIGESAFVRCSALSSVTIPNGVTSIGKSAFYECYPLSSVTIPSSVTGISDGVFGSCYAFSSITIPDGVTSIGNFAFYNCSSLLSITIPDSVTSISDGVFDSCYVLSSITFESSTPPNLSSAFPISYTCIIRVPQGSLSAYTSASYYPDPSEYIYEEY